jgi:hypothetical protein
LIISVTLLQRSVAIQLDSDTIISVAADLKGKEIGQSIETDMAVTLLRRA